VDAAAAEAAPGAGVVSLLFVAPFKLSDVRFRGRAGAAAAELGGIVAVALTFFTGIMNH
jgi:hypothetical protein